MLTYKEYRHTQAAQEIPVYATYFDTEHFSLGSIRSQGLATHNAPSDLVMLYGPNPTQFPELKPLAEVLREWRGVRTLVLTDAVNSDSIRVVNHLRACLDIVVGLDQKPLVRRGATRVLGPMLSPWSRRTFTDYVVPHLGRSRPIDVGLFGSKYTARLDLEDALAKEGHSTMWFGGGYGGERLALPDFLKFSCQVKIRVVTLGSVFHPRRYQLKGHVAEALMTESLLLVDQGSVLQGVLREGHEFVSFSSSADLIDKVGFYLRDETAREQVARAGHRAFVDRCDLGNPWSQVFSS